MNNRYSKYYEVIETREGRTDHRVAGHYRYNEAAQDRDARRRESQENRYRVVAREQVDYH